MIKRSDFLFIDASSLTALFVIGGVACIRGWHLLSLFCVGICWSRTGSISIKSVVITVNIALKIRSLLLHKVSISWQCDLDSGKKRNPAKCTGFCHTSNFPLSLCLLARLSLALPHWLKLILSRKETFIIIVLHTMRFTNCHLCQCSKKQIHDRTKWDR